MADGSLLNETFQIMVNELVTQERET